VERFAPRGDIHHGDDRGFWFLRRIAGAAMKRWFLWQIIDDPGRTGDSPDDEMVLQAKHARLGKVTQSFDPGYLAFFSFQYLLNS
jgi:hypothetical protein